LTVIERRPGWQLLDLVELWRFRELLFFLVWRDIKVRYKQTVLGAAWAVLQPLATMVVFSLFLGVGGMPSGGVWYPLFVFAGLLPWFFFANAVTSASQSVVSNQNLVTKIYFPRLFVPLGAAGAAMVDFAIAFVMLLAMMLLGILEYDQTPPNWELLFVPVVVLALTTAAIGLGILLSALTVYYRDFRHIVPFLVQLWMFATPSVYMRADLALGPRGKAFLWLNPINGLIAAFRQAMLGGPIDGTELAVSCLISAVLLVAGCLYFRRVERSFADII
jgi:lipopolysaccharide transport system permease protein